MRDVLIDIIDFSSRALTALDGLLLSAARYLHLLALENP